MGQAKVEPQAVITGLAVILGQELKESTHPLLHATQTKKSRMDSAWR